MKKNSALYACIFAFILGNVNYAAGMQEKEAAEITYGKEELKKMWLTDDKKDKDNVCIARIACRVLVLNNQDAGKEYSPKFFQLKGRFADKKIVRETFLSLVAKAVKSDYLEDKESGNTTITPEMVEIDVTEYDNAIIEEYIQKRGKEDGFGDEAKEIHKKEVIAECLKQNSSNKSNIFGRSFFYGVGTGGLLTVAGWGAWKYFNARQ